MYFLTLQNIPRVYIYYYVFHDQLVKNQSFTYSLCSSIVILHLISQKRHDMNKNSKQIEVFSTDTTIYHLIHHPISDIIYAGVTDVKPISNIF